MKQVIHKRDTKKNDTPDPYPDRATLLKILDHMYDELYVINNKGECIYVNQACERHYGISPSEILGQKVWESTQKGYWYPPVGPITLHNKKTATYEQRTNTGKLMLVTATPILDNQGNVEMVVENLREISRLEQVKNDLANTTCLLDQYKHEVQHLRREKLQRFGEIVALGKAMRDILELAERVAMVDSTVLITGRTGTGKGVLASHIHKASHQKEGPFIVVNCAAIPDQLFESELFGYAPGAFTGAVAKGKPGLVTLASGGTLFLDEIAEIPLHLQAKLLHVLQEKRFLGVGASSYHTMNCRVLAATNRDLRKLCDKGQFREDLYYRLNTIEIEIPPLSDRPEDIIPLVQHFLENFDKKHGTDHYFTAEALEVLVRHTWPGNVRELEHVIERLVITAPTPPIGLEQLPSSILPGNAVEPVWPADGRTSLDQAMDRAEGRLIRAAQARHGSSYKVARALGISQSKAYRLIKKHCHEIE